MVRVADEAGSLIIIPLRASATNSMSQWCTFNRRIGWEAMISFCRSQEIRLLVDAHPFAVELHNVVAETSEVLGLPVVRVESLSRTIG